MYIENVLCTDRRSVRSRIRVEIVSYREPSQDPITRMIRRDTDLEAIDSVIQGVLHGTDFLSYIARFNRPLYHMFIVD